MAATVLEIPIEKVYISETSTVTVPNATETGGSFVADLNGGAVMVDQFRSLFCDIQTSHKHLGAHAHSTCTYIQQFIYV